MCELVKICGSKVLTAQLVNVACKCDKNTERNGLTLCLPFFKVIASYDTRETYIRRF